VGLLQFGGVAAPQVLHLGTNPQRLVPKRFRLGARGGQLRLELGHDAALAEGADIAKLREGMELTLKLMGDVMDRFGVTPVDPVEQPFDPEFHQAMTMQPRSDLPPNTVVAVMQKGYTLNGRLVRPALVMVSQEAS
jgi:molecular chaperone GrpE